MKSMRLTWLYYSVYLRGHFKQIVKITQVKENLPVERATNEVLQKLKYTFIQCIETLDLAA